MTAVRKLVDAHLLTDIFDLPPAFKNIKVEVILLPAEDSPEEASTPAQKGALRFSAAQIREWAQAPEIQTLVGALKGADLPADISITAIRNERLTEKYAL